MSCFTFGDRCLLCHHNRQKQRKDSSRRLIRGEVIVVLLSAITKQPYRLQYHPNFNRKRRHHTDNPHCGFATKLKKLKDDHLISAPAKDILEAALDVGHAASHRAHKPSPKEVNQVIDIVENLLHQHTLINTSEELRASTPRRG